VTKVKYRGDKWERMFTRIFEIMSRAHQRLSVALAGAASIATRKRINTDDHGPELEVNNTTRAQH
jgi:hypothetical protein